MFPFFFVSPNSSESVSRIIDKITLNPQFQQQVLQSTPSLPNVAFRNACLKELAAMHPNATPVVLRDCIDQAIAAASESNPNTPIHCVLIVFVVLEMLGSLPNYSKRVAAKPLEICDFFRDEVYANAARHLLYNEFPMHYKQTIKSILLDCNSSYLLAYKTLQQTPPPKFWSLFASMSARPQSNVPLEEAQHPEILRDRAEIMRLRIQEECAGDGDFARKLNTDQYVEYNETIECPVCIVSYAFEDFVSCSGGCLICRTCLGMYVKVGVYESGELRGKRVVCFLEKENNGDTVSGRYENVGGAVGICGCEFADIDLEAVLGRDVFRAYEALVRERILREAFGSDGVIACGICGYAEVKNPPVKPSIGNYVCVALVECCYYIEYQIERLRTNRYSDHVLLIAMFLTCEIILTCFMVSFVLGSLVAIGTRLFLIITELWVQPLELFVDMTGINPELLIPRNQGQNPSNLTVRAREIYKRAKSILEKNCGVLTPRKFGSVEAVGKFKKPIPFNCINPTCLVASCSDCGKVWEACHVCHETEKDSIRLYVEQAMSEAFIRTCTNCHTRFTKQSGCNKMTCPICKTSMCYVCRKHISKDEGYHHFCQHFRVVPGSACIECNKCDLYVMKEDEAMLREVKARAEQEWRQQHPESAVKLLKG